MPYEGSLEAIRSVLARLGIDPRDRMDEGDQDPEYTACRSDEIDDYFRLYRSKELNVDERAVLCCFLLEGLNEQIQTSAPHPSQTEIFSVLFEARQLHAAELAYWMNTSDPDQDNWWPITKPLLEHAAQHAVAEDGASRRR
jgi:hypothetical protein